MLDTNRDAILKLFSRGSQNPSQGKVASESRARDGKPLGEYPEEWITILSCLKRIRKWRVPPHWSYREWFEEVDAEATTAALQAKRDFDPGMGVPWGVYLRRRVMNAALTRYRREWSYAIRRASGAAPDNCEKAGGTQALSSESMNGLLLEALKRLSRSDAWLITELFWRGRSEANLGERLGITQQAVNKRKRVIFKTLHLLIENIAKELEFEL
jgi:DNA-directed RNA polymerase specialized sigma24 family protein